MKMIKLPLFFLHLLLTIQVDGLEVTDGTGSEKSDKLLKRSFKNWEERCLVHGGRNVLEEYLHEQENLVFCMMELFDLQEIRSEIERNKKSGDLDEVIKKYCNEKVPAARDCLASFLGVSRNCLEEADRGGLNISQEMVDRAVEFICHRDGDRVNLFLSEGGAECVTSHYSQILSCVNNSVPEIFRTSPKVRQTSRIHFYVFQQENCRKGDAIISCVEKSLLKCPDPTPANLVQALLEDVRAVTTCSATSPVYRLEWLVVAVLVLFSRL